MYFIPSRARASLMRSRLFDDISQRLIGWQERDLRVSQFDDELTMIGADAYVGYAMTLALESYIVGIFEVAILLSGLALEEHLSLVYERVASKFPNKRFVYKDRPVDVEDMKFGMLTTWAKREKIIDSSWADDPRALEEIQEARNLFAHAEP